MFWRRKQAKKAVEDARRERQRSEKRLAETQALVAHINQIKEENHFADAIISSVLKGHVKE